MEANASNAGMQELLEPFVRKAFEDLEHIAACFKSDAVVAMGSTVRAMAQLGGQVKTNKKTSLLSEKAFMELCDKAKGMETERIVDNYNLSYEMAEAVPPCCMILKYFFNLTGAKELMIPMTSTKDALLLDFINNSFSDKDYFEPQILALADKLADKYHCNYDYTDNVVKFAEKLFRKLEPLHGLDKEDLILLKLAAKLHKIGLFVSNRAYHKLSFFLIEASEIPGISKLQHRIVALTARYHRKAFPKAAHVEYMDLPPEARDCVCKLGALLRLACGLAASYSAQDRLKVKIEAEEVVIRIEGVPEVDDGGYLKKKSKFFEYVYAREVVL
jgi:exopolyphosphatase/guanosine-5'-triphosphate,3'-diphosphate pyrophosphatase